MLLNEEYMGATALILACRKCTVHIDIGTDQYGDFHRLSRSEHGVELILGCLMGGKSTSVIFVAGTKCCVRSTGALANHFQMKFFINSYLFEIYNPCHEKRAEQRIYEKYYGRIEPQSRGITRLFKQIPSYWTSTW